MWFGGNSLQVGLTGLGALLLTGLGWVPGAPADAAELKSNLGAATPFVVTSPANAVPSLEPASAGAALVGNLLAPRPLAPDVPLPRPDLAAKGAGERALAGPRIFGRQEDGGAVVGLRIPIPADRGAFDRHTRYGEGGAGSESR